MRILVTGSSGLIGSALVASLEGDGHSVVRLVRRPAPSADEVTWDPVAGTIDASRLAGIDAAVHLAGEGIGAKRWTREQKQRITESRVRGTTLLASTFAALDPRPGVFVSGSAVGYYGLRGDEVLTEESSPGTGFLAELCREWEASTAAATNAGIRTVLLRTGIVLSAGGGALGKVLPLFKLGLGGRLGRGDQWWSWISLADEVGIIKHAIAQVDVSGPVNATAPEPATNAEITKMIGTILGRPTFLAVPKFALGLVMGRELTEEVILAGQRVLPRVASSTGYAFAHPDLAGALRAVLEKA